MPKKRAKKLTWLFWLGPVIAVVAAPILLHAAASELSESTDEHLMATAALLSAIAVLSLLGFALDELFDCPRSFPLALVWAQVFAIFLAGMLWPSIFGPLPKARDELEHWLRGHLKALPKIETAPQTPTAPVERVEVPRLAPSPSGGALRGKVAGNELPGWRDVGDGFCLDGESKEEFSSLHAIGKSLLECAAVAAADPESIALDFSLDDGGCDIRFPASGVFQAVEGFQWWGWGAGQTAPIGSGHRKHDSETRCFERVETKEKMSKWSISADLHPNYQSLIHEYPFQPVRNERGDFVNVILVRSPFRSGRQETLYQRFKDEILFLGISSWEDYPLPTPNPFSEKFSPPDKYLGLFPGFLYMHRNPETIFPSHVKLLLLSQSDFSLPGQMEALPKKYDFTFSGSDQDVAQDCVGWSSFAKNWSFVKEALDVMCGEMRLTGVLVATKDKQGQKACSIPRSCKGLVTQTTFLSQEGFFHYVRQSNFLFLPQVHDASPRVITQALALDVPLLMNNNLIGGWKYLTKRTGEGFNDVRDIKASIQQLLQNSAAGIYEPRRFVDETAGDELSGSRLRQFVEENFADRVKLPTGTRLLFPSG
ncbi:unnamed protein product, partial [Effrenium voratum]